MKTNTIILGMALLLASIGEAWAQGGSPAERRAFREFTSPDELVSIAPTTGLDKALAALSEVSKKFTGKVIIDTEHRTMPIEVDIKGLYWRDALESICRKLDLWYTEYDNYMQIDVKETGTGTSSEVVDIKRESATIKSREIKISAVFFEVNLGKLTEVGVNWDFMKDFKGFSDSTGFSGGEKVSDQLFNMKITPKVNFATINVLAHLFSNYDMGEILSSPQLIVRSGEEGRIQVGQDFSIKERDFAGNLIDKFYSAGTIVKVKPQVITEKGINFVHMMVDVERSNVVPGQISTILNKTKANTNLLLLDGEETIIGGLYSSETGTIRAGVPLLKDLPWWVFGLRYLFGYNRDAVAKKELIILLKAELVPTLQERITQKAKDEHVFERWREEMRAKEAQVKPPEENK